MMKHILLNTLIILTGCQPQPAKEEIVTPSEQPLDPTLFAPKIGHTWIYQQTSFQTKPGASLPVTQDQIQVYKTQRTQRYLGPIDVENETLHRFSITHDDTPRPDLLLGYGQNKLVVVAAEAQPDGFLLLDRPRIPLAQKEMQVGTFWRWPPGAKGSFGFRIVSREEVRVPAGVFDAFKITYQGDAEGVITLKDYWFTPGTGIIREESHSYQGGFLRSQSIIELEKIVPPDPTKPVSNP